jgi:AmmeMemoRadiSam system protein A
MTMNAQPTPLSRPEKQALLDVARTAISDRLLGDSRLERLIADTEITPALASESGLFVTLTEKTLDRNSPLRGCVGTMRGTRPLYLEVAETAVSAAFDDPRFPPLDRAELARIVVGISVLSQTRPLGDWREIEIGVDGVQLVRESNRSVFLPQVAVDQRWDREQLLEQLALKAGLDARGWRDAQLFTFRTESFVESVSPHSGG